jgi:hypothetical protein
MLTLAERPERAYAFNLQERYFDDHSVAVKAHLNGIALAWRMDVGMPARDIETRGGKTLLQYEELIQQM